MIYVRNYKKEPYKGKIVLHCNRYWREAIDWETMVVGFCGKIYPILKLRDRHSIENFTYCHSMDDADKFVESILNKKELEAYYSTKKYLPFWSSAISRKTLVKYFEELSAHKDKHFDLFLKYRCPVFSIQVDDNERHKSNIFLNAVLKNYGFVRVIDPYTAYQEVSMFVGGMANPEKPIPQLSDKDMLIAKGFDKWSFKKPPRDK